MRKILSIVLIATMLFSASAQVFAATSDTTSIIEIEGEWCTLATANYTDYSRAIIRNAQGDIIVDMSLNDSSGVLFDNLSNTVILQIEKNLIEDMVSRGIEDQDYHYLGTNTGSLKPASLGLAGTIGALTLLIPGGAPATIKFLASTLCGAGAAGAGAYALCYYELEIWMANDNEYDYCKRMFRIYSDKACTSQVGDEIIGYQKKAIK